MASGVSCLGVRGDQDRAGLFASTPWLNGTKAVLVLARQDLGEDIVAMLFDVKKAHLNGSVKLEDGDHLITLPEEVWRLRELTAVAVRHLTREPRSGG